MEQHKLYPNHTVGTVVTITGKSLHAGKSAIITHPPKTYNGYARVRLENALRTMEIHAKNLLIRPANS